MSKFTVRNVKNFRKEFNRKKDSPELKKNKHRELLEP